MMNVPQHPFILVIDPSRLLRKIMQIFFRRAGGEVFAYSSPQYVFTDLQNGIIPVPDVVFLSLVLPGYNSYRVIRLLTLCPHLHDTAIIAMTPKVSAESRIRARLAGAIAYLPKPFTTEQLFDLVLEHSKH